MKKFEIINFRTFKDDRGTLTPIELDQNFPFPVKRIYFVTANKDQTRGGHAHIIEDEIFIATNGTITAIINDGTTDQEIILDSPNKALLVRKNCWHEFHNFSTNATMCCLSSTHYLPGEKNYITDKKEFFKQLK